MSLMLLGTIIVGTRLRLLDGEGKVLQASALASLSLDGEVLQASPPPYPPSSNLATAFVEGRRGAVGGAAHCKR
jgi:hypothetical protein